MIRLSPPLDRDRLAHILGMLGSAFDGEVTAAGRIADALVKAAGLSWPEVVSPLPRTAAPANGWATVDVALADFAQLNDWEQGFILSLHRQRGRRLSPRQLDKLAEIEDSLRARREGRA